MKTLITLLMAVILLNACQQAPPTLDKAAAQKSLAEILDAYNKALNTEDVDGIPAFLTDDAMFLGTDPGEFWNKQRLMSEFAKMKQDTAVTIHFTIDKRETRLSEDGKSAVFVEQTVMPSFTKMPLRMIGHAVQVDGKWKIDFYSWNFITENKNIQKLNDLYP